MCGRAHIASVKWNQTEENESMRHSQSSARWLWASLLMRASLVVLTGETMAEPKAEETFTVVVIK